MQLTQHGHHYAHLRAARQHYTSFQNIKSIWSTFITSVPVTMLGGVLSTLHPCPNNLISNVVTTTDTVISDGPAAQLLLCLHSPLGNNTI